MLHGVRVMRARGMLSSANLLVKGGVRTVQHA